MRTMELTSLLLAVLLAASPLGTSGAGQTAPPNDPDLAEAQDPALWKDEFEFVPFTGDRADGLDWRLLTDAAAAAQGNNVVVSPASVKLLLAMLYEGAAGATADELARALQLGGNRQETRRKYSDVVASLQEPNPEFKLDLGMRMFIDDSFTPRTRYLKIVRFFYDVLLQKLDFDAKPEAARQVNDWVQQATSGYIRDLVKPDDLTDVVMMLANAVFFEGQWQMPFSEEDTAVTRFFPTPDAPYQTPFMQQTGNFYYYNSSAAGAQMLRLPYKGNKFSMFILLPHDMNGVDAVAARLADKPALVRQLMWNATLASDLRLLLPRFTFETRSDVRALLQRAGINDLFNRAADLQGVVSPRQGPLFVSAMVQKALIEVNEQGTKAAAATQASTVNRFGNSGPVFNARHPFLFIIEDESTATVLFAGKVSRPGSAPPLPPSLPPQSPQSPQPQPASGSAPGASGTDRRFSGGSDFSFDLSSRFGSNGLDRRGRPPPPVITSNDLGNEGRPFDGRPFDGRPFDGRPFDGPFDRRPQQALQPLPPLQPTGPRFQPFPQPPRQPQQPQQPQQPSFAWTWPRWAGRTPASTFPMQLALSSQYFGTKGQTGQNGQPGPQLVLIPVYAPIRKK